MNLERYLNFDLRSSPPASPLEGQVYEDTTTNTLRMYHGSEWIIIARFDSVKRERTPRPGRITK